jgi:hypothetical protein
MLCLRFVATSNTKPNLEKLDGAAKATAFLTLTLQKGCCFIPPAGTYIRNPTAGLIVGTTSSNIRVSSIDMEPSDVTIMCIFNAI